MADEIKVISSKILDGYKKLIISFCALMSINFTTWVISKDATIDGTHRIELYILIIATIGALAGIHGLIQSRSDKSKLGIQP